MNNPPWRKTKICTDNERCTNIAGSQQTSVSTKEKVQRNEISSSKSTEKETRKKVRFLLPSAQEKENIGKM